MTLTQMQQLLPIEDRVSTLKEATKAILLAKMATLREQAAPGGEQSKRDSAVKAGVPEGGATEGGQSKRASAIKTGVTEGGATEGGATEELTMLSAVLNYTQVPNPKELANFLSRNTRRLGVLCSRGLWDVTSLREKLSVFST